MRNTRIVPLAVASSIAILLLLVGWHHDATISPVIVSIGSQLKGMQSSQSESDSSKFIRESFSFEHSGYKKWVYSKHSYRTAATGSVLVASSLTTKESFGTGRSFQDFYETLEMLEYPKSLMALSFYCGSPETLETVRAFFDEAARTNSCPYNQVIVLYAPFLQSEANTIPDSKGRGARDKNFIIQNALEGEQYTLFLDADVTSFDQKDILQRFVDSKKDIIVPTVVNEKGDDYDPKSWRGSRTVPSSDQLKLMDEGKWGEATYTAASLRVEVYNLGSHVKEIEKLLENDPKRDMSYVVDLDSVGGSVLFAKSVIYKQGILFPTLNIVGTSWSRIQGYDGIESEGLCYMARSLGYKCHGMPNLVARHSES